MQAIVSLAVLLLALQLRPASGGDLQHPEWRPDGKRLVTEGSCQGGNDLYSIYLQKGIVRNEQIRAVRVPKLESDSVVEFTCSDPVWPDGVQETPSSTE